MLTIAGVTFTDTEAAEITADLERYDREMGGEVANPYEGMTTSEIVQFEHAKRHTNAMAEAKAEFDEWDKGRAVKQAEKKLKWFGHGKGQTIGFPIHLPKTLEA